MSDNEEHLTKIRIRRGVTNGVPIAVIHAPDFLEGSTKDNPKRVEENYFEKFEEFLRQKGLVAIRGVGSRTYRKVIRIADFGSDYNDKDEDKNKKEQLDAKLRSYIAEFKASNHEEMKDDLVEESINIVPQKHNGKAGTFLKWVFHKIGGMDKEKADEMENLIRSNSGTVAGLAFLAGHINLMIDAAQKGNVPRGLMTACFMASSLVIATQSGQDVKQKSLDEIVNDALKKVREIESQKTGKPEKGTAKEEEYIALQVAKKLKFMVENHPWETASMLSLGANVFSMMDQADDQRKGNFWSWTGGVVSSLLGFGAAAVRFFPSKGRPDLLGIEDKVKAIDDWAKDVKLADDSLINNVVKETAKQAKPLFNFMQSNKLLISGVMGALSGVGMLVSSIFKRDWAMVRSNICWLFAQGATALAVEKPGYSEGDAAFVAKVALEKEKADNPDKVGGVGERDKSEGWNLRKDSKELTDEMTHDKSVTSSSKDINDRIASSPNLLIAQS